MDNLNLISLNVRGLRGSKRYVIYNYLKEIDIMYACYKKRFVLMNLLERLKKVGKVKSYTAVAIPNIVKV